VKNIFKSPLVLAIVTTIVWLIILYTIWFIFVYGFLYLFPLSIIQVNFIYTIFISTYLLLSAFIVGYLYSLYFKEPIPNQLRLNTAYLTAIMSITSALIAPQAIHTFLACYGQAEILAYDQTSSTAHHEANTTMAQELADLTNRVGDIWLVLGSLAFIGLIFWVLVWLIYQGLSLGSRLYFYHKQV
jgi:hypothetical protein